MLSSILCTKEGPLQKYKAAVCNNQLLYAMPPEVQGLVELNSQGPILVSIVLINLLLGCVMKSNH